MESPAKRPLLPPALQASLTQAQQQLRTKWVALPAREQKALAILGLVLGVAIFWLLLIQPAWRTARDVPAQIDQLERQTQKMRSLVTESQTLRDAATVSREQAQQAIDAATERLQGKGKTQVTDDRVTLTITGVSGNQLSAWLAEVRGGARAKPVEAQLTRAGAGYSGTLVVVIGAGS